VTTKPAPATVSGGRSPIVLAVFVAAGVVAGVGSSLLVARWQAGRLEAAQTRALERRFAQLEEGSRRPVYVPVVPVPPAAPGESAPPAAEAQPSPGAPSAPEPTAPAAKRYTSPAARAADRLAELRAHDEKRIRQHWSEPIDPGWSATATPALRKGLEHLAESSKFKVANVDCRNTSCLAVFDWPSYADAEAEYAKIAHETLDVNCGRGITLPEVADPSKPLQATMYFNCAHWKSEGSRLLSAAR
jgi:hypothetical protein